MGFVAPSVEVFLPWRRSSGALGDRHSASACGYQSVWLPRYTKHFEWKPGLGASLCLSTWPTSPQSTSVYPRLYFHLSMRRQFQREPAVRECLTIVEHPAALK